MRGCAEEEQQEEEEVEAVASESGSVVETCVTWSRWCLRVELRENQVG